MLLYTLQAERRAWIYGEATKNRFSPERITARVESTLVQINALRARSQRMYFGFQM